MQFTTLRIFHWGSGRDFFGSDARCQAGERFRERGGERVVVRLHRCVLPQRVLILTRQAIDKSPCMAVRIAAGIDETG